MDTMESLERRIENLRQLLSGEGSVELPDRDAPGLPHTPAHAVPGPLLDDYSPVLELVDEVQHTPAHAAPGSADLDELAGGERAAEVIRLKP